MGSFQLAIFILYYLQVVYALAQSSNDLGGSFVQQDPATGQSDISGVNGLAPQQEGALGAALSSLDQSNAPLPQASTNTDNAFLDPVNETPGAYGLDSVGTRDPNLVAANTDDCASANQPAAGKLKARGGKQRRAPPNPKSVCPTTGGLLPANRKPQAPSGVQQLDPNIWPNVLKVPTKDGDNPACYEATHGLMPIGVCENPLQNPRASEFDPLNTVNPNLIPRAWKLKDCSLAWPGMQECVPRSRIGIWCCKYYGVVDGIGWADICWPLNAIQQGKLGGASDWQKFWNPLILPPK